MILNSFKYAQKELWPLIEGSKGIGLTSGKTSGIWANSSRRFCTMTSMLWR